MDIFITNIKSTNWTIKQAACIFLLTTLKFYFIFLNNLGPVWYMCLKTENYCLKTFVEIRVGEKVYWKMWNIV